MSGKFEKKKTSRSGTPARKRKSKKRWILPLLLLLIAAVIAGGLLLLKPGEADSIPTSETAAPQQTEKAQMDAADEVRKNLDGQLEITDVGSYTGIYMEDGSDELVSGILMIVVRNLTDEMVQYAKINMQIGEETASFTLTTLPSGASAVLLEQSRMTYDRSASYGDANVTVENIAYPLTPMGLHEDKLKLQVMDGIINITNISQEDIAGEICIYYKNAADDIYYGGITYRSTISGGLKAGELRQIQAAHYRQTGSEIMFVTIGE